MEGDTGPRDAVSAEWFASTAAAEEVDMLRQWVAGLSTELARARGERDQAQRELEEARAELARARSAQSREEAASAPADRAARGVAAAGPAAHAAPSDVLAPAAAAPRPVAPAQPAAEPEAAPRAEADEPEAPDGKSPEPAAAERRRGPLGAVLRRLGLPLALFALGALLLIGLGPLLLPYKLQVVHGDSMAPALPHGTLVLSSPVQPTDVWPDNVIVFQAPTDRTRTITHRVVGVTLRPDGVAIQTRGDANADADPWVVQSADLRGRVVAAVPLLGHPLLRLQALAAASLWGLPIAGLALIAAGYRVLAVGG